jgi:hypothetical protein
MTKKIARNVIGNLLGGGLEDDNPTSRSDMLASIIRGTPKNNLRS